jgi:hypothetical protein
VYGSSLSRVTGPIHFFKQGNILTPLITNAADDHLSAIRELGRIIIADEQIIIADQQITLPPAVFIDGPTLPSLVPNSPLLHWLIP